MLIPFLTDNRQIPSFRGAHAPSRVVFGALAEYLPVLEVSDVLIISANWYQLPSPFSVWLRRCQHCRAKPLALGDLALGFLTPSLNGLRSIDFAQVGGKNI